MKRLCAAQVTRSLAIFWIASAVAAAQPVATSDVEAILAQAHRDIRNFEKAGGKKDDPNHPVEKWVQTLWHLYEESPGKPAAAKAASEAVHLLVHANRFQEANERADRVPPEDPAWEGLPEILIEGASLQNDFTYVFRKLPSVLSHSNNPTIRAAIQWNLGRAWRAEKNDAKAKAAFEAAVASAPDSSPARQAARQLYELLHLGAGQPAPLFSATDVDRSQVALAHYRGKPVVIVFWSST